MYEDKGTSLRLAVRLLSVGSRASGILMMASSASIYPYYIMKCEFDYMVLLNR